MPSLSPSPPSLIPSLSPSLSSIPLSSFLFLPLSPDQLKLYT